jgi:PhnB protein
MLSDDFPEWANGECRAPDGSHRTPVTIHMEVADIDQMFARAVAAGAVVLMPVADMFWGDRFGKLRDPFGHEWTMSTPIKK